MVESLDLKNVKTQQIRAEELGGQYEVVHHTEFLKSLLDDGRLAIEGGKFKGKKITFVQDSQSGTGGDLLHIENNLKGEDEFVLWFVTKLRPQGSLWPQSDRFVQN